MMEDNNQGVSNNAKITGYSAAITQLAVLLVSFLLVSYYSYSLFHGLVEMFTVIVAGTIFAIAWNARRITENNYLLFLGLALVFAGIIDVLHVFAYKGISVIPGSTTNMATQFWLAARLMTSLSFVAAIYFIRHKVNSKLVFSSFFALTLALSFSIIYWQVFPVSFVEGIGLTGFKIYTEYLIIAVFFVALYLLYWQRSQLESRIVKLISLAIALMIVCEFFFTKYLSPFDLSNMLGHLFKAAAFYFLYLAIVETGLMKPYRVLFKNLKDREVLAKESEERYRTLVENSPSAIILHAQGKIVYINQVGVRLFGAQNEGAILGKSILDLIASSSQRVVFDRMEKLLKGERVKAAAEIKIKTLNDQEVDVEVSGSVAKLQGKAVIQTVMYDISKRKAFERQLGAYTEKIEKYAEDLSKFKLAVDNASDAIYITDEDFKVLYANRASERTTGYFRNEIIGKTTAVWRDEADVSSITSRPALSEGGAAIKTPIEETVVNKKKNGQQYTAQLEVSPILDQQKEVLFYVIIERDVSRQKEIDQARNEFVSLASHQLRTPLASIALSAELLARGIYGELNDKQQEAIKEIFSSSDRMKEMISDLLNISRIELGTISVKLESVNLQEQIEYLLKEQEMLLQRKSINLEKQLNEDLPTVKLDKNILEIVVDNLLSNAIRYTPVGGKVTVALNRHGDDVILSVKDTGVGIPVNEQGRVFEKLYRADNAQAISAEGTGLGLYMVKSALKKIGGSIWVESVEGQGSTFFVRWPIREQVNIYHHDITHS